LGGDGVDQLLAVTDRRLADFARRKLGVLFLNGARHIAGG